MEDDKKKGEDKQEGNPYLGNIWGWKLSYISLGIILFFIIWMAYLHWKTGTTPSGYEPDYNPIDSIFVPKDTTGIYENIHNDSL